MDADVSCVWGGDVVVSFGVVSVGFVVVLGGSEGVGCQGALLVLGVARWNKVVTVAWRLGWCFVLAVTVAFRFWAGWAGALAAVSAREMVSAASFSSARIFNLASDSSRVVSA